MSSYLLSFRGARDSVLLPETMGAWAKWQLQLGARLKDRGYPTLTAQTIGAPAEATTLGGYSVIRATAWPLQSNSPADARICEKAAPSKLQNWSTMTTHSINGSQITISVRSGGQTKGRRLRAGTTIRCGSVSSPPAAPLPTITTGISDSTDSAEYCCDTTPLPR